MTLILKLSVLLVGGFIGSFPQVGMNIKNIWNHHLVIGFCTAQSIKTWENSEATGRTSRKRRCLGLKILAQKKTTCPERRVFNA